jgi:hypothetical protein
MKPAAFNLNVLSPHLFWDVDSQWLTFKDNKQFVVKRILEYGLFSDWIQLNQYLDIDEIADIVSNIKDLDYKSLSFISTISRRPREKFLCYTIQQSTPPHWNF